MTAKRVNNVLFLRTGNSARSILAEVLIGYWGKGRFKGYSAGSFPKGAVHPLALEELERRHLPTAGLRSKSWDEFTRPGAGDGFCLYGLRSGSGRNVPDMAQQAGDRPLRRA